MQSCIRDTSTFPGIHMPHAAGPELGCYETFVRSDLPPCMEPVSIIRVALPRDRPCPLAEA